MAAAGRVKRTPPGKRGGEALASIGLVSRLEDIVFSTPPEVSDSERFKAVHKEASSTVRRVFFAVLGTCLFCIVTLAGSPDMLILSPVKEVELPILSYKVGFESFLLIGPAVLIALITYLHLFVGFQRLHPVSEDERTPILPNMPGMSAKFITWLLYYWLVPATLAMFIWKAWPHQVQGPILFGLSAVAFFGLILVQIRRCPPGWRIIGTVVLALVLAGSLYGFSELLKLRRLNLVGVNLAGANLEERSLAGADLSQANLSNANLRRADLSSAVLRGAVLVEAQLEGVELREAVLSDADIRNAVLTGAELSNALFDNAKLADADLSVANLSYTYLVEAEMTRVDLTRATLSGADLANTDLTAAIFAGAELRNVTLRGATLDQAGFQDAIIAKSQFDGASLRGADFTGAQFFEVEMPGADLRGVKGLTADQLKGICGDGETTLDDFLEADLCPGAGD